MLLLLATGIDNDDVDVRIGIDNDICIGEFFVVAVGVVPVIVDAAVLDVVAAAAAAAADAAAAAVWMPGLLLLHSGYLDPSALLQDDDLTFRSRLAPIVSANLWNVRWNIRSSFGWNVRRKVPTECWMKCSMKRCTE